MHVHTNTYMFLYMERRQWEKEQGNQISKLHSNWVRCKC